MYLLIDDFFPVEIAQYFKFKYVNGIYSQNNFNSQTFIKPCRYHV